MPEVPAGFAEMKMPADNALSADRIALGKKLFFDPILSADGKVSCASCHKPAFAFADTTRFSTGAYGNKPFRNTPSLINVGYQEHLFADGTVPALEFHVFSPLADTLEMHKELPELLSELQANPEYNSLAQKAYGRDMDELVLSFALACFQRTLVSAGSKFDAVFAGKADFSKPEKTGWEIFEKNCRSCHSGFLFSDQQFHNIGTGGNGDFGRSRLTYRLSDREKFKTATLRNVALTVPYLHDGSAADIEAAVKAHKTPEAADWNFSKDEMKGLVRFLHTLTDKEEI